MGFIAWLVGHTWYRGEAVSKGLAKAGTVENDIGDGMYLTDNEKVAQQYAKERAPSVEDKRVYSVKVKNLRILDLTTDVRWKKHVSFPLNPAVANGDTIETSLKNFPASGRYKEVFNSFLKANKINLKDFDAVVGLEYRLGGKQMCVLYNTSTSNDSITRLRTQFTPIGATPTPATPAGHLKFGGKIGPGLKVAGSRIGPGWKAVGGALGLVAMNLLIQWLGAKYKAKADEAKLNKELEALRPTILSAIPQHKEKALALLAAGKSAFATVRLSIIMTSDMDLDIGWMENPPTLEKKFSVEITDKSFSNPDGSMTEDGSETEYGFATRLNRHYFKLSLTMTFEQEEIDLYRAYQKELAWYDDQIAKANNGFAGVHLAEDRYKLQAKFKAALVE
jgi:hypothetical protein